MKRGSEGLVNPVIDLMYSLAPGEPDRASLGDELFVLTRLAAIRRPFLTRRPTRRPARRGSQPNERLQGDEQPEERGGFLPAHAPVLGGRRPAHERNADERKAPETKEQRTDAAEDMPHGPLLRMSDRSPNTPTRLTGTPGRPRSAWPLRSPTY